MLYRKFTTICIISDPSNVFVSPLNGPKNHFKSIFTENFGEKLIITQYLEDL